VSSGFRTHFFFCFFDLMMTDTNSIKQFVTDAAAKLAEGGPLEIVNVEIAGTKRDQIVRVYLDKPGGVTVEDCAAFSHAIDPILEEADIFPGAFVLEVSSPGIERELYSVADFERFTGELARVKLTDELNGQTVLTGYILGVAGDVVRLEDKTSGEVEFDFTNVKKANLKIDLNKEFGRK
jgi:ribosome maturation factor RimP